VTLAPDPNASHVIRAIICYRGVGGAPLQTLAVAPQGELEGFALKIAEALNGLRANATLPATRRTAASTREGPPSVPGEPAPHGEDPRGSLAILATALSDATSPSPLFGASVAVDLPATRTTGFSAETYLTLSPLRVENGEVRVAARVAWLRLGMRKRFLLSAVNVDVSAMLGPAVTWATADAVAPRIGSSDLTLGGLLSLGAQLEFPRDSSLFLRAAARASSLLPSVRFQLGSERTEPYGRLFLEGSLGLGVRLPGAH
jgi:hypothetical protein